jgi:beta-keto acid cleavage enzyme
MINHVPPAARPAVPAAGTLISVAPTGAETAKANCPQLPTTLAELVETAIACEAAGASLIHVRDADHRPSLDPVLLRESVQAVREQTSMLIQLSTGGNVDDPLEKRLTVQDGEPDSASLTCGTTNFGDDVFLNPHPFIAQLYPPAQQRDGFDGLGAPLPPWIRGRGSTRSPSNPRPLAASTLHLSLPTPISSTRSGARKKFSPPWPNT